VLVEGVGAVGDVVGVCGRPASGLKRERLDAMPELASVSGEGIAQIFTFLCLSTMSLRLYCVRDPT